MSSFSVNRQAVSTLLASALLCGTISACCKPSAAQAAGSASDVIIADFNGSTYPAGWTETGTAFGTGPSSGTLPNQNIVTGFEGAGLVNSFTGGDDATGTLTSPAFTISRHYLRFLVGGGNRPNDEYIALLVDGTVVRKATGGDAEDLGLAEWDVSEFAGKSATIEIVDNGTGGWGHVLADDLVLTDHPLPPLGDPIVKAMTSIEAAIPLAAADPTRPVYHFHAPAQWMNDPNGFIQYGGWYHMFYQFNPYASTWGHMHWGHARSRDLVNWEQLPVAIPPSLERGEEHVFSGSVFLNASGYPTAFYTSISTPTAPRDPEVWAAHPTATNMFKWAKLDHEPVISEENSLPVHIDEWRDPFLVSDKGITYLVTGGEVNGKGVVCLYQSKSPNLTAWTYRGVLFQYPNSSVPNIECPNLFKVGGKWALLMSVNNQVEYFTGTGDLATCKFDPTQHGVLEAGSYASQVTSDIEGRQIEFAWIRPIGGANWAGCFTLPNVVTIDSDGTLVLHPASSLQTLRTSAYTLTNTSITDAKDLSAFASGDTLELSAEIDPGTAAVVGITLRASADGTRGVDVRYNTATQQLSVAGAPDNRRPTERTEPDSQAASLSRPCSPGCLWRWRQNSRDRCSDTCCAAGRQRHIDVRSWRHCPDRPLDYLHHETGFVRHD